MQEALPGHLGIDDLEVEEETGPEQWRTGEAPGPAIKASDGLARQGSVLHASSDGEATWITSAQSRNLDFALPVNWAALPSPVHSILRTKGPDA